MEPTQYTDIQLQFLKLLQKYPIKNSETIVDYITSQGETVLEDPEKLAVSLAECEISPVRRRQVLKHWFSDKGVEVPPELLRQVSLSPEKRRVIEQKNEERKAKYSVDETGAIKVASTEEKALTWDEAQKLSRAIKRERGDTGRENMESPFITDDQGSWILNPKARVTGVELLALESIRRSQDRGEPVDPIEVLGQAAEKMRIYQEVLGGGARQLPEWMTDPAKFVETVKTVAGGGKGDEGIRAELVELRQTIADMREGRYRQELAALQRQIDALMQKPIDVTGRSELDILHEVTAGVLDEAKGLRGDVKSYVLSQGLPQPKTPEQREAQKQRYRTALAADEELEVLGRRLFFGEKIPLPSERRRAAAPPPPPPPEPEKPPPEASSQVYE